MNARNYHKLQRLLSLITAVLALFLVAGCGGGDFGKLSRDKALDNSFLNYEILPDHRYYITGGYAAPTAIMAIHMDYELVNDGELWVGVPRVDSFQMRKWIDAIGPEENFRYTDAYFASYILDQDGNKVGAWYSFERFATVKFPGGNKIEVYPPERIQSIQLKKSRIRI